MAIFKAVLLLCLATLCLADGGGSTQTGYGSPSGYGAPTGSSGYDAQVGYDYEQPQQGYETSATDGGDDIGAKIGELIPLFIAVFAAIILAQLLSPLLLQLLGLLVGILPMALSIKAPIINVILNTFGLQLCTTATPPVPFTRRSFTSRSLKDAVSSFGFDIPEAKLNIMAELVENALSSFNSAEDQ
jgi:hypothetical protein